jgi:hypothetical protein
MLSKNMDKSAVNLLGILSFTPLISTFYLLYSAFFLDKGLNILPFAIAAWLTWIGVLLLFSIFLIQSTDFLPHQKFAWIAILAFFGMLSLPLFWWIHFKSPDNSRSKKT